VSGLLGGAATEVIRRWRAGAFDLILSAEILAEYEAVLSRPRFKLPPWVVQELLGHIRTQARWVVPSQASVEIRDPQDAKFLLQAALSGEAAFIVTEDKDLLDLGELHGVRILPPWDLLPLL